MELNLFLLILFLQLSHLSSALITSSVEPLCNELDQVALSHFKNSFSLDQTNYPNPIPHLLTWILPKEINSTSTGGCCSWKGVTCEVNSGHVTGLDLSYGFLRGTIDSTNAIFRMRHLQKLNLAGNDFSQSEIPSALGNFSMLKSLNLSQASFSGSIPQEILALLSLTSLDLSGNPLLHLPRHGLTSIAQNMKNLTELSLGQVNLSSTVPATFANLTSLRMLHLPNCSLQDQFPDEIFLLPKLESINLMNNSVLYGHLPEFPIGRSSLRSMELSFTNFYGKLPNSIGNLISLQRLDVSNCNFSGPIPYTIGNLVNLIELHLSDNHFNGSIPSSSLENLTSLTNMSLAYNPFSPSRLSWIGNLTKLKGLDLSSTNLNGSIPSSLAKIQQIEDLSLNYNLLSGPIPPWIGNLTRLGRLRLAGNSLEGQIPSSIFSLKNLWHLNLRLNNLSGTVDISMFHELKNISKLKLSSNHLSVVSKKFLNFSLPNLELLALDSCNLREFPLFLKNQDKLKLLSLGANDISGELPEWFFNVSTKTLVFLDLSYNFLRFEQPVGVLPWSKLEVLDLSSNNINGSLPLPPQSITFYSLSNNSLGGKLSPTFCKCSTLFVLDLSNNELGGSIPECLGNLGSSLKVWNLESNRFEGKIPHIHTDKCSLQWINLSQNQLRGKLPRTIAKCTNLERLDVGDNHITDTFPSWLGTLLKLQVLILKSNNFHGPMGSPSSISDFPELRMIDLSSNALTGALPSEYFPLWKAMKTRTQKQLTYLQVNLSCSAYVTNANWTGYYHNYSMNTTIMDKGMDMEYLKLSNMMVFLSLSRNKFFGEIPESIGDLVGLHGLDLSNNCLTGSIPPALGNLNELESLDLSLNMLSGEIPQQLGQLTFLEYLNVSYNNLSGLIPGGKQLGTFRNNSFDENPGLCGFPLLNKCWPEPSVIEASPSLEGWDLGSLDYIILILMLEGFVAGLVIGLSIGYIITTINHEWFVKACLLLRSRKIGKDMLLSK